MFRPLLAALILFLAAPLAPAQEVETVAGEVWLGGSLFTIEDLENLDAAVTLAPDQKDAAQELMRGAMARARTMSLRYYRNWQDQEFGETDQDPAKFAEEYKKKMEAQMAEVVKLEKEVMTDLKALLTTDQSDLGWQRFERSRRRLIIRGAQQIVQHFSYTDHGGFSFAVGMQEPLVDVIALVRASKLSPEERAALAEALEPYEAGLDSLVSDWRPFARQHANTMMYYTPDREQPSQADKDKMKDIVKRIRQLQVRTARRCEDLLSGPALERFQRQRLRRESQYRWMPAKRSPEMAAILRLRSLTTDQKTQIEELVKDADSKLLKFAMEDRHASDDAILLEKEPDPHNMWGNHDPKRMQEEANIRKRLTKDALALLTTDQQIAYDTGIENEQDLVTAFEKRRGPGDNPWEVDADLNPWQDMWEAQREEE